MRRAWLLAALLGCSAAPEPQPAASTPRPPAPPAAPVGLATGAVVDVGDEKGRFGVRLASPGGDEAFLAILVSTRIAPDLPPFRYAARRGLEGDHGPTRPSRCAVDRAPTPAKSAPEPPRTPPGGLPAIGTKATLSFRERSGAAEVPVRLVAVGKWTLVWADETPGAPAVLEDAFVGELLRDFEATILPRARSVFGNESDVDGDGRIALFFTPRTAHGSVAFFSGCDLEARCPASNRREILYLTPPNAIAPPYDTPRAMKEILSHELEHLIHHARKVLNNSLRGDPDSAYLLEGFGALAQDALGFQAGNLYVTQAGLEQIDDVSVADLLVEGTAYDRRRDGPLRGGAYLFVRWLYDRAGGDGANADGSIEDRGGPTLVRALLDAPRSVAAEIPVRFGASTADITVDFFTTLALAHAPRGSVDEACFRYLPTSRDPVTGRQRGADLRARFHGMEMKGPAVQALERADGRLLPGGVELLVIEPAVGEREVAFEVTVDEAAQARLRVARVR